MLKGALGQEDWHSLVEGGSRGLACRGMVVASTLSTLGMRVRWSAETLREIHVRILRFRGISQRQCNLCIRGHEARAPVRSFGFEAPPPWRSRACNSGGMASSEGHASPRPSGAEANKRRKETPSNDATGGRELRLYCPWASCIEVTSKQVHEQPLDKGYCRRIQVYCKGFSACCMLTAALCAQCHKAPSTCHGHEWQECPAPYDIPRGRRPGQWRPGKESNQLTIEQALGAKYKAEVETEKDESRMRADPISQ